MSIRITHIVDKKQSVIVEVEGMCMHPECGWRSELDAIDVVDPKKRFQVGVEARRHVRRTGHTVFVTKKTADAYREKPRDID